jgi:AraC-like DNA-binding protein
MIALSAKAVPIDGTKANNVQNSCPIIKIDAERLPNMSIPRSGHSIFVVNDEVTVVGGHTSGFKLTPTAEYLKDNEWHQLHTVYSHDGGMSIVMKSGKVLLAGGFKDNLGISQSFEVELYDPKSHSCKGFGCLNQKRASAAAVELDHGQVLITGNWYADDEIELYDGKASFSQAKAVSQSRYLPHVLRTSGNDAMIVAGYDMHGEPLDTIIVDRLHGEAIRDTLFSTWRPLHYDLSQHSDDSFIGDEAQHFYRYLLPVENGQGQLAIVDVRDTVFSLLPTICPIPMKSQWGAIKYITPVFADRLQHRGYVLGFDETRRVYALCIDYAQIPAKLTLYHTDPLPNDAGMLGIPVLTKDGNMVVTGGIDYKAPNENFLPKASVWLLRFNGKSKSEASLWPWLWIIILLLFLIAAFYYLRQRKARRARIELETVDEPVSINVDTQLMQRITILMEEKQLFKVSDLKVSDIANELRTNARYVSDCIKNSTNYSFTQYVNSYRIQHAQQIMRDFPDQKISTVFLDSGFTNETTFFRAFKAITGMTPKDWKNLQND